MLLWISFAHLFIYLGREILWSSFTLPLQMRNLLSSQSEVSIVTYGRVESNPSCQIYFTCLCLYLDLTDVESHVMVFFVSISF